MKTPLLLIAFLFLSTLCFSQDITRQKEAGVSFFDFDSFGLFYRTGKSTALWRFNSVFGSVYSNESKADNPNQSASNSLDQLNLAVSAGREYRKVLADGLEGRLGFDVSFSYSTWKSVSETHQPTYYKETQQTKSYNPGVNAVIGLNYVLKQKLILGAELVPGFYYSSSKQTFKVDGGEEQKSEASGVSFSLNNWARITIGYRF